MSLKGANSHWYRGYRFQTLHIRDAEESLIGLSIRAPLAPQGYGVPLIVKR